MIPNWMNPVPIVREYIAERRQRRSMVRKKVTIDERLTQLQNTNLNKLNSDGRINYGYDDNGQILAHSVSPFSNDFLSAIEPEILNLIVALMGKCYLPLSSCQGHCLNSRRYVTLAFKKNTEKDFIAQVNEYLPQILIKTFKPEEYMNMELKISEDGVFAGIHRNTSNGNMAVKSLNKMFTRDYNEYIIVELNISQEVADGDSLIQSIKKKLYKIFLMDRVTSKLIDLIQSDKISFYMCEG